MDCFQPAVFYMRVDLRRRDTGVTEHFLKGSDFSTSGQHVRREAVS